MKSEIVQPTNGMIEESKNLNQSDEENKKNIELNEKYIIGIDMNHNDNTEGEL